MQILSNPITSTYLNFKKDLLSANFPWFWGENTTPNTDFDKSKYSNVSCYSHTFLCRPEENKKYPTANSNYLDTISIVFKEILDFNNINLNTFMRINANCTHPYPNILSSVPHLDHTFTHKNIIIYFTNSGGDTFVNENRHSPKEDDVLLFEGIHYYQTPLKNRRIISVATFI